MDWVVGLFYQEREEGWDFHTMTEGYAEFCRVSKSSELHHLLPS